MMIDVTADPESLFATLAPANHLDSLDRRECLRLIGQARFGRLALAAPGRPAILPVRVESDADGIHLTADATADSSLGASVTVALEVDHLEPGPAWSVILSGTVVTTAGGVRPGRFTLDLSSISGRRVNRGADQFQRPADDPVILPAAGPLSRADAYRLLALQCVGRLAVAPGGYPRIFPVNYVLDGEAVVFRTDTGTKLHAVSRSLVAFEADWFAATGEGWSVVVSGWAHEVTPAEPQLLQARIQALPLHPWAAGDRPYFVRIVPVEVMGRSHRWE